MPFKLPLCAVVRKEEIDAALASAATPGKRLLEPLKSRALAEKLPINILEDKEVSNEAEVHRHEGDPGREPFTTIEDAAAVVDQTYGIYASHLAGRPVKLPLEERKHPLR